jgi:hypothetical protein
LTECGTYSRRANLLSYLSQVMPEILCQHNTWRRSATPSVAVTFTPHDRRHAGRAQRLHEETGRGEHLIGASSPCRLQRTLLGNAAHVMALTEIPH